MLLSLPFAFFKLHSKTRSLTSGIFILVIISSFFFFKHELAPFFQQSQKPVLGKRAHPIVLGIVPSTSATQSASAAQAKSLRQCLENTTHLYFQIRVATHHTALIEALSHGHVQGALLSSYAYFLAHRQGASAILRLKRDGTNVYYGQIVVKTKGPIQKIEDLQGKVLATVDATSTSSLYGLKWLREHHITPSKIWVANTHIAALLGVYQNPPIAHAAAVYYHPNGRDARRLLMAQYPQIFDDLKTLVTVGPIPNEPFVVSSHFPAHFKEDFRHGLKACAQQNPEIFQALSNGQGLEDADDSDYKEFFETLEKAPQMTP